MKFLTPSQYYLFLVQTNSSQLLQGWLVITAEKESVWYVTAEREDLWTSKLVWRWSMRYQLSRPAITACEVGFLHDGGGIPCRPHPTATQLVNVWNTPWESSCNGSTVACLGLSSLHTHRFLLWYCRLGYQLSWPWNEAPRDRSWSLELQ